MCSVIAMIILCMIQVHKRRKLEKKIKELSEELERFMIDRTVIQGETLEEGTVANLWNEIIQTEQLFCYQQNRSEEEKVRLNQFIENMAHQMKTTMTALQIRLDSAQMAASTKQEAYAISRSQECMERMTEEIARILNSSQLAANKVEMHFRRMDGELFIHGCIQELESLAERKQVLIDTEVSGSVEIYADEFWLKQAVENIIKNALEHTDSGGIVKVKVRKNGNEIEILVEDEGEGINAEELPYLFQRFQRAKATKVGYGIGLSMASDIVKAHYGEICAGNRRMGGMWFFIKLPILNGAQAYDNVIKNDRGM